MTYYVIWLAIKIASDIQNRHHGNFTCVGVQSTGDQGRRHLQIRLQAEFCKINIHIFFNCAEIKNSKTRRGYSSFKENSPLSDTTPCTVTKNDHFAVERLQIQTWCSTLGPEKQVPCRYTRNWPRAGQLFCWLTRSPTDISSHFI